MRPWAVVDEFLVLPERVGGIASGRDGDVVRPSERARRPVDEFVIRSLLGTDASGGTIARSEPLYWEYPWPPFRPQVALLQGPWKISACLDAPRPRTPVLTNR